MITGGIKFFKKSKALFLNGTTAIASSNSIVAKNILGSNKFVRWVSVGSNDTITETITITMPTAQTINRIFLISHNFKEFTVKYDVAGTPTNFSNVLGLLGATANISETIFDKDTAYYEFASVTTTKIYITATKTQIVNEEKSLERFYCTEEIGTLIGYPDTNEALDQNLNKQETLSGNLSVQKRLETFNVDLNFKNFPAIQNDYDIILDITRRSETFLVWLCGGKFGPQFSMLREGWNLRDVYPVQATGKLDASWNKNIYIAGFSGKIKLDQATEVR